MFLNVEEAEYEIIKSTPGLERIAARYAETLTQLNDYASVIERARMEYALPSDDDLEIDDKPSVSVADDGVWVSAWVWIYTGDDEERDEENTCRTCGEEYAEGGDGFDGECPDCADKSDQKLHPENYE